MVEGEREREIYWNSEEKEININWKGVNELPGGPVKQFVDTGENTVRHQMISVSTRRYVLLEV